VVAVWSLSRDDYERCCCVEPIYYQAPNSRNNIIRCCCVVPIPDISLLDLGIIKNILTGGPIPSYQAPVLIQHAGYKAINYYNQFQGTTMCKWLLLWVPLRSLLRNIRSITPYNPIHGAIYFIISIVAVCSLLVPPQLH